MPKYKYFKQYRGKEEREPVSEDEVKRLLSSHFHNVKIALTALQEAGWIRTTFSVLYAQEDNDA